MTTFHANEKKYLPLLARIGANHGLAPEYLVAIARQESAFDPNARSAPGAADDLLGGAFGLCQMTMDTARVLGFKGAAEGLFYPDTNAEYAALLAVSNAKRFKLDMKDILQLAQCHNGGEPLNHIDPAKKPRKYTNVQAYGNRVASFAATYREACAQYAIRK